MTTPESDDQVPTPRAGAGPVTHVIVGLVCAVAAFAMVYALAGPGSAPESARNETKSAKASPTVPSAQSSQNTPSGGSNGNVALPTGTGKNPLSVGEMAMFVFKQPEALPEFTFKGAEGQDLTFADWKGRVVLVNLWATWCAPCRKEMPDLAALQTELGGDDFEVVAISLDRGSADKPRAFLKEVSAEALTLYHDPTARIGNRLNAIGLPATLLLDRSGREIGRLIGPADWDSDDAKRLVRAAIDATRTPAN
ncbi:MAG: TlpA disulfide reductase family protein [Pseudomonadota bacterium]